jgi:hypothetical protein
MLKRIAQSCIALSFGLMLVPAFAINSAEKLAQLDDKKVVDPAASATAPAKMEKAAPVMFFDRSGADRASIHLQILQQSSTHFADCTGDKKVSGDATETGGVLKPVSNSYKQY